MQQAYEHQNLVVASARTRCENGFEKLSDRPMPEPNQSPEPTSAAVTIPAAQEIVPAALVAHL